MSYTERANEHQQKREDLLKILAHIRKYKAEDANAAFFGEDSQNNNGEIGEWLGRDRSVKMKMLGVLYEIELRDKVK